MAYCTVDDIRIVLSGTAGSIPAGADDLTDDQLNQALLDAQAEIDMSLSRLYVVPLSPVPEAARQLCINIAVFLADMTFRMSKDYGSANNPLYLRYTRARKILDGIASGLYHLNVDSTSLRDDFVDVFNPYDGDLIDVKHLFGPARHASGNIPPGNIFEVDDINRVLLP